MNKYYVKLDMTNDNDWGAYIEANSPKEALDNLVKRDSIGAYEIIKAVVKLNGQEVYSEDKQKEVRF
jgi:hypothetical protein